MIEDDLGEKFGYYLNTRVKNVNGVSNLMPTDMKSFEFNLKSNGRLMNPMKFEIKNTQQGYIQYDKSEKQLIQLGDIVLYKYNERDKCYCEQKEDTFDYHGIENALCGKKKLMQNDELIGEEFTLKRIIVIQMEMTEEQKLIEQQI